MSKSRRAVKRAYRRYTRRACDHNCPPGLIDRKQARYMGYLVPMSLREWVAARCP